MSVADSYEKKVSEMYYQFVAWKKANPDTAITYLKNYPDKAAVMCTLKDALHHKFLWADDNCIKMFNELGWLVGNPLPTLLMTLAAMELKVGEV